MSEKRVWRPVIIRGAVYMDEQQSFDWADYRKRPVVIQAVRMEHAFDVETLEGVMHGEAGDWLIRGVAGELYPCKDSIFQQTYEPAAAHSGGEG